MRIKYATFGIFVLMGVIFLGYVGYYADWENMTLENSAPYLLLVIMIGTGLRWYYKKIRM